VRSVRRGAGSGDLKLPPLADANVIVEFAGPALARGIYGARRSVRTVAIAADTPIC